ncbi:hypothetical protein EDEG_02909 [Edhazardia aedis USNM 41457]|uniref:DNA-directed RNA polymerases I, II, and III subunit RPABC1 n=1 Tax=Edhazardia aedis (strain USNM 41457) TaxID=1003232 RepID=J9DMV7_EDHAE|nr:hypothetical protein EDEG_02909 [Edhazardia aedis USNM 41457]|eukprot:EJW02677.1 hypothetical protein EDEG_02909 [Edhazardia aedis USNM 41457]
MDNAWHTTHLCRETVIEMLQDRGYISNRTTKSLSLQEFMHEYSNALQDRSTIKMLVLHSKTNEQLVCHFFDEAKVGLKALKLTIEGILSQKIENVVLVCKEGLSPAGAKFVAEFKNVEVFKEKELLFNVTKHMLVPKHRILEYEEKCKLLECRRIKESQLPRMLITDRIARHFGAKRGDVFEIVRSSETAGESLYYRIVV